MTFSLALIPARGGSKGLPGKNIRLLGDIPMIAWTITAAREAGLFERIVVSTDDVEIAAVARTFGAETPFVRPARLASDDAGTIEVVRHALAACSIEGPFALLQPTSPFRDSLHLQEAAALYLAARAPAVIGVTAAKPPSWTFACDDAGTMRPTSDGDAAVRRQDGGMLVQPNGSIYMTDPGTLAQTGSLLPPGASAFAMNQIASIDIDTPMDFEIAEAVLAHGLVRQWP